MKKVATSIVLALALTPASSFTPNAGAGRRPWVTSPVRLSAAGEWKETLDVGSGKPYYWNPTTKETVWVLPPGATVIGKPAAEEPVSKAKAAEESVAAKPAAKKVDTAKLNAAKRIAAKKEAAAAAEAAKAAKVKAAAEAKAAKLADVEAAKAAKVAEAEAAKAAKTEAPKAAKAAPAPTPVAKKEKVVAEKKKTVVEAPKEKKDVPFTASKAVANMGGSEEATGAALVGAGLGFLALGPLGLVAGAAGGLYASSLDGAAGDLARSIGTAGNAAVGEALTKGTALAKEAAEVAAVKAEEAAAAAKVAAAEAAKAAAEAAAAKAEADAKAAAAAAEAEAKRVAAEAAAAEAAAELAAKEAALAAAEKASASFAAELVARGDYTASPAAVNLLAGLAEAQLPGSTQIAAAAAVTSAYAQGFLEATPYHDQSDIPVNTFKAKSPYIGKVVSVKRIVGPKATGETCDIVIDTAGGIPYWEGQSFGVIPPGTNPKNGKPNTVRLYSIAASRYGDDMSGKQTTLCVRRATYWCPELKAEDPAKKGICSNYLCDATPGTEVKMTGPSGKVMLLPEATPEADIIMVATGTGIAPFRSMWKRLFIEDTEARANFKGLAWLFLGVANSDALLYDDELQGIAKDYPANFKLDYALSREQTNVKGGKMYIQDKVEEYSDDIFTRLDKGAHMYFCGLKGMMPGIQDMLKGVCESKGLDYDAWIKGLKEKGQWHVEVY